MTKITFVDEDDNIIGSGSRAEAVSKGIIHRIVRIFVFNPQGELLVQKRSATVASPNKWDQSAGGHVDEGEEYLTAALRELEEEIGISSAALKEVKKFFTDTNDDDSESKKRFNMLYETVDEGSTVSVDEREVSEVRWIGMDELGEWMQKRPQDFTRGFIQSYNLYMDAKHDANIPK